MMAPHQRAYIYTIFSIFNTLFRPNFLVCKLMVLYSTRRVVVAPRCFRTDRKPELRHIFFMCSLTSLCAELLEGNVATYVYNAGRERCIKEIKYIRRKSHAKEETDLLIGYWDLQWCCCCCYCFGLLFHRLLTRRLLLSRCKSIRAKRLRFVWYMLFFVPVQASIFYLI